MFDITDAFETAEAKLAEVFTKEFQIPDLGYAFGVATWCFWLFLGGKVMFKFLLPRCAFLPLPFQPLPYPHFCNKSTIKCPLWYSFIFFRVVPTFFFLHLFNNSFCDILPPSRSSYTP